MTRTVTKTQGTCVLQNVRLGKGVRYYNFVNLYGCTIGEDTRIAAFVEIQKNAVVGARCRISSHVSICEGVTIEDEVFVGQGVTFVNDPYPRATGPEGKPRTDADWKVVPTRVRRRASIGNGATILCGVTIGEGALVGAGAVVTTDVAPRTVVAGNPAKPLRTIRPVKSAPSEVRGVPPFDLSRQMKRLKLELMPALERVIDGCAFALGHEVQAFEREFASTVEDAEVVGVSSGTSALHLALLACGVGPGDEVVVPALTFAATAWAVSYCGATPVFVDVDPRTLCMDPAAVAAALTPRGKIKAVIAVHLYGQAADLEPLVRLCQHSDVALIEDAAQAHGASYQGRPVGTFGRVATFSFYPTKNLGAAGEAGCVVTRDKVLADEVRVLRDQGQREKYLHTKVGYNYRMDGFQAAVLRVKLGYLDAWNARRRQIARAYLVGLAHNDALQLPVEIEGRKHVWHQFVVRHPRREEVRQALDAAGVGTSLHYPRPLHLQPAYAELGVEEGSLPAAERAAQQVFSLPMFPEMTDPEVEFVVQAVNASC